MTNNILDVLTFMFDILFESAEQDSAQEVDDDLLKSHLSDAGFDADRIEKALHWLENIAALQDGRIAAFDTTHNSMRIYNEVEKNKLDAKSRGFIMFMENMGQLSASQREIVIDQVMSLEDSKLTIDDLKWVVMMVIGNSTEAPVPAQWIESIVFYDDNPTLQ
jgi:Smg protein